MCGADVRGARQTRRRRCAGCCFCAGVARADGAQGAVLAMTRELAMVHAREGIRINNICPYVPRITSSPQSAHAFTQSVVRSRPVSRLLASDATRSQLTLLILPALLMDFLNTEEKRQRRLVHLPMGRFGEAVEVAKGALFRTSLHPCAREARLMFLCFAVASDDSSYMTVGASVLNWITIFSSLSRRARTSRSTVA